MVLRGAHRPEVRHCIRAIICTTCLFSVAKTNYDLLTPPVFLFFFCSFFVICFVYLVQDGTQLLNVNVEEITKIKMDKVQCQTGGLSESHCLFLI